MPYHQFLQLTLHTVNTVLFLFVPLVQQAGISLAQHWLTIPDAKVHGLCGPNHPDGQQHVVADLCSLEGIDHKEEMALLLCVYY